MSALRFFKYHLVLLFLSSSLNVNAQIQRYFWGLEVGSSNKSHVKALLNRNSIHYEENIGGFDAIATVEELNFAGYSWSVTFSFYNNILSDISFLQPAYRLDANANTYNNSSTNISTFNNLKSTLRSKYASRVEKNEVNSNMFMLRDNSTLITLELTASYDLVLTYMDRKIIQKIRDGSDL